MCRKVPNLQPFGYEVCLQTAALQLLPTHVKAHRNDEHVKAIPERVEILDLHLLHLQDLFDEVVDDEDGENELATCEQNLDIKIFYTSGQK